MAPKTHTKGGDKTTPKTRPPERKGGTRRVQDRRDETLLRASEEKYRQLFELDLDALFMIDKETAVIEDVNRAAVLLYGYSRNEMLKMNVLELSTEPDKTRQLLSSTSGIVPIRYHRKKDGTVFPAEITFNDFVYLDRPMRIAAVRDITERVEMEKELIGHRQNLEKLVQKRTAELSQANAALRSSQASLQGFYDSATFMMGVAELDEDRSTIVSINRAAGIFLKVHHEDLPGTTGMELDIPAELDRLFIENYRRCQREGAPVRFEYEYPHTNGMRWLEVSVAFIGVGESGSPQFSFVAEDVTERKHAEEELRKSEQWFSTLFNKSAFGITLSHVSSGMIVDVNPEVEKQLGFTRQEMIGKTAVELGIHLDPETRARIIAELQKHGFAHDLDMRVVKKDGSSAFILVNIDHIEIGGEKYSLWTARNITERKRTEEKLRESEEQYRFLLDNTSDFIARFDRNGVMRFGANASRDFHGYELAEIINTSAFERIHPEDRDEMRKKLKHAIDSGDEERVEYRLKRKSGEYMWVEAIGKRVFNSLGEPEVIIVQRDITERKQAEEERRESEDQFKHIFDLSIIGKSITKLSGEVQVNLAFCKILGYSSEEFQNITWQEITHPDDVELTQREIQSLLSREKKSVRFEKRFIHKNGSIIWVDLSSTLRLDKDGSPLYLVSDLVDITERKQAEVDLIRANKALTTLHEMLREQAARDALTGLHNRRYLYETIERELSRAKREGYPVSVVMIDVDHFKEFNDNYGHQAGDEVLIALGNLLQTSTRQGDVACRYGGEEFILVMPGAQLEDAIRRAEGICRSFEGLRIKFNEDHLSSTISVGVALYPKHGEESNSLIKAADLALYQAKEDGRNCVRSAWAVGL